jgi:hypothetical protein
VWDQDCDWNISALLLPRDKRVLEMFDVEVAFSECTTVNPVCIEETKVLKELVFLSKEEFDNTCA